MGNKRRFKCNQNKCEVRSEGRITLTADRSESKQFINWFPGHMNKALKQIKSKLKLIDIVLEIRDARLPLTSGNPAMDEVLGNKLKLIVLNKMELTTPQGKKAWEEYFKQNTQNYIFINALDKDSIQTILAKTETLFLDSYYQQNPQGTPPAKINMMMVGLPNTGKSTLINRMSGRNAARTADKPGHTQSQQWIKIADKFELLDTPGIMPPKIHDEQDGLRLAVIHAIPSKIVSEEDSACYLAKYLIEQKNPQFQKRYKLETLESDFQTILIEIGRKRGFLVKKGEVDFDRVYKTLLQDFREGELGQYCFELP